MKMKSIKVEFQCFFFFLFKEKKISWIENNLFKELTLQ